MSRNLSRSFDYLTNGVAYAVAEVENVALAAIVEVLYSKNMSLCKVGNVDIVTNTSSVWSVVISAVNGDCFTLAIGHLQNKRNKMTFRVVCLADCAAFISTASVEVTERNVSQTVSFGCPLEHFLHSKLCFSVWVCWTSSVTFEDRNILRLAVCSGC